MIAILLNFYNFVLWYMYRSDVVISQYTTFAKSWRPAKVRENFVHIKLSGFASHYTLSGCLKYSLDNSQMDSVQRKADNNGSGISCWMSMAH